jgi:hypothetical protein
MDFLKENKIIITKLYYLFVKKTPSKKESCEYKTVKIYVPPT